MQCVVRVGGARLPYLDLIHHAARLSLLGSDGLLELGQPLSEHLCNRHTVILQAHEFELRQQIPRLHPRSSGDRRTLGDMRSASFSASRSDAASSASSFLRTACPSSSEQTCKSTSPASVARNTPTDWGGPRPPSTHGGTAGGGRAPHLVCLLNMHLLDSLQMLLAGGQLLQLECT